MRKIVFIALSFLLSSCAMFYQRDLDNMEAAVRQHIRDNDKKSKIVTNVSVLKALSYKEVPELEREQADDVYCAKMYLSATWSYLSGDRVFNTNDTIDCYFNKNKVFVRVGKPK